jgi:SAM-dependent methyltransferase
MLTQTRTKMGQYRPAFQRYMRDAESRINHDYLSALSKVTHETFTCVRGDASKFLDYKDWLPRNIQRAIDLNLHLALPLSIMDIGCGAGYFLLAAKSLGHTVMGTEIPREYFMDDMERLVFPELTRALNCRENVQEHMIERFVRMPFNEGQFDLITAFMICFNRHRQPDEWGIEEWHFFVSDARRCLRPGGRLFLELNTNDDRYSSLRYYDDALLTYFLSMGEVIGNRVTIYA